MGKLETLLKTVQVLGGSKSQGEHPTIAASPIKSFPTHASGKPENASTPNGAHPKIGKKKAFIVQVGSTNYLTAAHSRQHAINQATSHAKKTGQSVGVAYRSSKGATVKDMVGKKLPVKGNDGVSFKWTDGHLTPVKSSKKGA